MSPTFPMTVNIVNSPPVFTLPPTSTFSVALNSVLSYSFSDPEGNVVTVTTNIQGSTGTPTFVTFTTSVYKIQPTLFADVGTHIVQISLCDGQPLCSAYTYTVTITNTAPVLQGILTN